MREGRGRQILMCILCNVAIKPIQFDKLGIKLTDPGVCFMFLPQTAIIQSEKKILFANIPYPTSL